MAIRMKYLGTHLPELTGKIVQVSKLARLLGLKRETLGACLRRSERVQKNRTIDDEDLARYLGGDYCGTGAEAVVPDERYSGHRALMARAW
tara:strand:+ start:541 stop:813 length:273 start_codon:yes stop_codon:yes gene_type:complete